MTVDEFFSMYDFSVQLDKAMALDAAGDMNKLNDDDFIRAWKYIGNKYGPDVGILNCLKIHPYIKDRMVDILSHKSNVQKFKEISAES